jgi:hypothetical protein
MIEYKLENYEEALDKQVIHMDQAVCYNPEFKASKMMHDYPSRKLQIARSIMKGELEANEYSASLLYKSLLSRQGERWQNFGESPEDCTDAMILSRAMVLSKGFGKEVAGQLTALLDENGGHLFPVSTEMDNKWKKYIKVDEDSTTYLFLDDATYNYAVGDSRNMGEFLTGKGMAFHPEIKANFAGWEYFAHGMIEEGKSYMKGYLDQLVEKGIDTIVTMSGQVQYLLTVFIKKLGLDYDFKVVNILEMVDQLKCECPVYLYAGTFYTRYLRMEEIINNLVENTYEEKTRNSIEFIPLLESDKRVNKVTIWQMPVDAEFKMFGFDDKLMGKIKKAGIDEIKKGIQVMTVAFDPYSYNAIKEELGSSSVYFGGLL